MRSRFSVLAAVALIAIISSPAALSPAVQAATLCFDPPLLMTLQADNRLGVAITDELLEQNSETIVQRLNGLGIYDAVVQIVSEDEIEIEFQRVSDATDAVLGAIRQTGLLEIIDTQGEFLPAGTYVTTSLTWPPSSTLPVSSSETVYETVVDGRDVSSAFITTDSLDRPVIGFVLTNQGADDMFSFTSSHIGQWMSIVIDKQVVSSPTINAAISRAGIIDVFDPSDISSWVVILNSKPLSVPMLFTEYHYDSESTSCMDPTG